MIVPISRQEIADLLGIRRETLSRLLKDLRHLGFVDVQGRTFKVSRLWLANDLKTRLEKNALNSLNHNDDYSRFECVV